MADAVPQQIQTFGTWTKDMIDTQSIGELELKRSSFLELLAIADFDIPSSKHNIEERFKGLILEMQTKINKYPDLFPDGKPSKYKIEMPDGQKLNFFELKELATWDIDDKDEILFFYEKLSEIYDYFLRRLKVEISTTHIDPKKN